MAGFPDALSRHLPAIEDALREAFRLSPDSVPAELAVTSRYVLGWESPSGAPTTTGGKRIRPALCMAAAELFTAEAAVALPGAVALELIHNFSLVHDDVQDRDAERHGRPTVWVLRGEGQAINAGDYLITAAFRALLEGAGAESRRLQALTILNDAMSRMIAGQWADITFESRHDVSTEEYLAMVRGKTGALFGAPLAIGAILAGAPIAQARALGEWGETVGLAFQVQDDYLGIWGDPNLTGKSNTGDIARRKKTLPIVWGLTGSHASEIMAVYQAADQGDEPVARVKRALELSGAHNYCRNHAAELVAAADTQLEAFELPETSREHLRAIGRYLVNRER